MYTPSSHSSEPSSRQSKETPAEDLLSLLGSRGHLGLPAALARLGEGLGVEHLVPPPEARGVVADELLVVDVVVLGAGPEGQEVPQAPGEVVAAVGVDGLEEAGGDPDVHGDEVEVAGDEAPQRGGPDGAHAEDHDLDGGGVLGGEAEGRRVVVVQLVDVLVEGPVVEGAVGPVVPGVLHDEEDADLEDDLAERGEVGAVVHAAEGGDGVEEPDLRELDGEVAEEDDGRAARLLLERRDFLLRTVGQYSDNALGWGVRGTRTFWILYLLK